MIQRPQADEYNVFYAGYIQRVPEGINLLALLGTQPAELRKLLIHVTDEAASVRPAPAEWSVKEVLGHIVDTERVFAYRTLSIARGDQSPLPGFDQDNFVKSTDFNERSLDGLLDEFDLQRRSNVLFISALSDVEIARQGIASGYPISVRALLHILAGHVMHHVESLKTDYNVGT